MSSLIVIANSNDAAVGIARMQYRLTGEPMMEIEDIPGFIIGVRNYALGNVKGHGIGRGHMHGQLSLLTVICHGSYDGPYVGSGRQDQLTRKAITTAYVGPLMTMRSAFAPNAEVRFGACLVGQNPWLLADLSVLWGGIKVTGFTTLQTAGMPIFTGDTVSVRGRTIIQAPSSILAEYSSRLDPPKDPLWKGIH